MDSTPGMGNREMTEALCTTPMLTGLDLLSPEYTNNPERFIARAHREQPVYYYPPMNIWVLTKHSDVHAAFMDASTFSSQAWGLVPPPLDLVRRVPDMFTDIRINSMDPPQHAKLRVPVQQGLLSDGVAGVEDAARRIANELIDRFIGAGRGDLMQEFCYRFPLYVVLELLGLPKERAEDYHRWGASLFALFTPKSPEGSRPEHLRPMPEEILRRHWENLAEANEYLRPVVDKLDRDPGNNLLSKLLQQRQPDGSRTLSLSENVRNALDFVSAGHDTTTTLIGHLVYYTHRDAALKQRLSDDSALIPVAVEETLRRRGSADGMYRITTRDIEVRGVTIPKGSIVLLHITAANLDPAEFPEPELFNLDRPNLKKLLSFGAGRHVCAGQHLARLEAKVAFEELHRRIPSLRLAPRFELKYVPTVMNVIIERLVVEWDVP